ncbi:MAG: TonB-dependent receptor [Bacteroidales bacterium]|nr:TonB-dependent receptor [Bacteroidales bacterium]
MKKIATLVLVLGMSLVAMAQNVTLKGVVNDSAGVPVIGAFVVEQGTSNGTMTGIDGDFSLVVRRGAAVEVSCIGYATQTILATEDKEVTVVLPDDTQMLEETVVIGYGVQKKSVVTASIAKVDSDALGLTAPTRVDNALKGLTAGVTVTASSGQPGASSRIRVRGVGSINSSDPVYIVDGMPISGGIDYLNPSDIESIEVLKDAASGAVYGTRAANGVVLVTTKKGTKGKANIDYNFSYGISSPWKEREVLNASEYALLINEGYINSGSAPRYNDPFQYGEGTDWQKEVFNYNAPQQTHEVSVSGASDAVNYYLSLGYTDQEGIVGGNFGRSNYKRLTLRSNTGLTLWDATKERNYLNKMVLNNQISYAYITSKGIAENSQWGSPLGSALAMSPILGVYATDADLANYAVVYAGETLLADAEGRTYMIPGGSYNEMVNPIASLSLPANGNWSHKFVGAFGGELQIWDNIKLHSTFSMDMSFWGNSGYTPLFYLSGNNRASSTNVNAQYEKGLVWQVENYLTWNKDFGKHSVSVLLGQSAMENNSDGLYGMRRDIAEEWYGKPYINNAPNNTDEADKQSASGWVNSSYRLASYFARADWNYDERYMAQVTFRRDGSSRFGANNKWGNFPSFSLGWNLHKEPYITLPAWFTTAKVRASWGVNGSDAFEAFRYTTLTSKDNNYIFGNNEATAQGVKSSGLANPDLHWEQSVQTNIGFDLGFFENALTVGIDLYNKTTEGMLLQMPTPAYVGESSPWGNGGKMVNRGVEFETSYKWGMGDWNFRLGGNATYLYNRLISMGNESGFQNYDSFQGAGAMTRGENGYPFPYFYGYKTDGIFQNQAEIDAYVNEAGEKIMPDAVPGDVRFVDVNGDGVFDADDRTYIGNGMPDWTFGLNFSAGWKNIDFYMLWQSTVGNDVLDVTRRNDVSESNMPAYMLGRWTGEGTSNKYPRIVRGDNVNWQMSDLYVQDGSYLRLKNIQLGYTLPQKWTKTVLVRSLRFYVAAENLLTLTSYRGYDPEISSGGTSLGVDYGVYPQPRTLLCGINLKF